MSNLKRDPAGPRRLPSGKWGFVVDLAPAPDGTRRQARRHGFGTKREALAAMEALRQADRTGTFVAPRRQTLTDFLLADWLPVQRPRLAASTWRSYEGDLRRCVLPYLGGVQLQALDPGALNRTYAELEARGLAPSTIRRAHAVLGRALGDAVEWGRLVRNPARAATPPSARSARSEAMRTWDAATLARFLRAEETSRYYPAWMLLATTGCRRGEVLGLRWSDVDLEAGTAAIRGTRTTVAHEVFEAPVPKSGRARMVRLDLATVAVLRTWKATQAAERLVMGAGWADTGLVFTLPDGRPYHPEHFGRAFTRAVARQGLPRIRLHDLRHTWATLALGAGVANKVVAERLGHASTRITDDVYSHVTAPMATDAAERVAGLIFGTTVTS